jgi:hypothetical protein
MGNWREAPEWPLAETAQRDQYEGGARPIVNEIFGPALALIPLRRNPTHGYRISAGQTGLRCRIIKTTLFATNVR